MHILKLNPLKETSIIKSRRLLYINNVTVHVNTHKNHTVTIYEGIYFQDATFFATVLIVFCYLYFSVSHLFSINELRIRKWLSALPLINSVILLINRQKLRRS